MKPSFGHFGFGFSMLCARALEQVALVLLVHMRFGHVTAPASVQAKWVQVGSSRYEADGLVHLYACACRQSKKRACSGSSLRGRVSPAVT